MSSAKRGRTKKRAAFRTEGAEDFRAAAPLDRVKHFTTLPYREEFAASGAAFLQPPLFRAAHMPPVYVAEAAHKAAVRDSVEFPERTHALEMGTSCTEWQTGRLTAISMAIACGTVIFFQPPPWR